MDYIRATVCHHDYPWTFNDSDGQSIRIYSCQIRACISILTGHNHYAIFAQFHPSEDSLLRYTEGLTLSDIQEKRSAGKVKELSQSDALSYRRSQTRFWNCITG